MGRIEDTIAKYDKTAAEYASNRLGQELKEELKKLFSYLHPGDKVLDIGCAAGRDTAIIRDAGFEATGVDLSTKLLEIAKQTHPDVPFVLADMRKLPFKDGSFDAIWASSVLHHLDKSDMPAALKEFGRTLKPNGILFIRTKMGQGILKTREVIVQGEEREFTLLTEEELDRLLTDAGYSKLSLYTKQSSWRKHVTWLNAFYRKLDS